MTNKALTISLSDSRKSLYTAIVYNDLCIIMHLKQYDIITTQTHSTHTHGYVHRHVLYIEYRTQVTYFFLRNCCIGNPRIRARQSSVIREASADTSRKVRRHLTKSPRIPYEEPVDTSWRVCEHFTKSQRNCRVGSSVATADAIFMQKPWNGCEARCLFNEVQCLFNQVQWFRVMQVNFSACTELWRSTWNWVSSILGIVGTLPLR